MQLEDFRKLVPADQRYFGRACTLNLWHRIYDYIEQHGSADVADNDHFLEHVRQFKQMSEAGISANLRRMAKCGLVEPHVMTLIPKNPDTAFLNFFPLGLGRLPTRFVRYTLPGKDAPTNLRRPQETIQSMRQSVVDFERKEANGPDSVTSLDDVEKLQHWLERKRVSEEEITESDKERIKKLVADARQLFSSIEDEITRNYCTIALRSSLEP